MKKELDFIIIGAQKAGTTSLHQYLREHPTIFLPAEKEAPFFNLDDRRQKGWDWYIERYFGGADSKLLWGKTSPQYMSDPRVPAMLYDTLPNTKIIAILRDPIARARSHYMMMVKRGLEERSFAQAMTESLSQDRLTLARELPARIESETLCYLVWGEYGRILQSYVEIYGREALLTVFSSELKQKPQQVVNKILAFLGIPDNFTPFSLGKHFHVGGMQERIPGLERMMRDNHAIIRLWHLLPERPRQRFAYWVKQLNTMNGGNTKALQLSSDLKAELARFFLTDLRRLERLDVYPPWSSALHSKSISIDASEEVQ